MSPPLTAAAVRSTSTVAAMRTRRTVRLCCRMSSPIRSSFATPRRGAATSPTLSQSAGSAWTRLVRLAPNADRPTAARVENNHASRAEWLMRHRNPRGRRPNRAHHRSERSERCRGSYARATNEPPAQPNARPPPSAKPGARSSAPQRAPPRSPATAPGTPTDSSCREKRATPAAGTTAWQATGDRPAEQVPDSRRPRGCRTERRRTTVRRCEGPRSLALVSGSTPRSERPASHREATTQPERVNPTVTIAQAARITTGALGKTNRQADRFPMKPRIARGVAMRCVTMSLAIDARRALLCTRVLKASGE